MKVFFVLLALTLTVSAFEFRRQVPCVSNTQDTACAATGNNCTLGSVDIGGNVDFSRTCNPTDRCTEATPFGTCTTVLGGDCTTLGFCVSIYRQSRFTECDGSNECVISEESRSAGDACTAETECLGAMNCTAGVCVGVAENGTCNPALQIGECVYGFKCDATSMECRPLAGLDETCAADADCAGFRSCNTDDNTCVDLFSRDAESCSSTAQCVANQFCDLIDSTCKNALSSGVMDCNNDTDCTAPQTCNCVANEMKCTGSTENLNQECITLGSTYRACLRSNQCIVGLENAERTGSCSQVNCNVEYACFSKCSAPTCPSPTQAALDALCPPPPSASSTPDGGDGGDGSDGGSNSGSNSGNTAKSAANTQSNWLL